MVQHMAAEMRSRMCPQQHCWADGWFSGRQAPQLFLLLHSGFICGGKLAVFFSCSVLLGFFNCLVHHGQWRDIEGCFSSGYVLSRCTWIEQEALAPVVCWLGSTGAHHHLPKRCQNLDLIWGWRCLYTPELWYLRHLAACCRRILLVSWLFSSDRVLASPRVEKAIFPLHLECCITWSMGHSSCAWHRHPA